MTLEEKLRGLAAKGELVHISIAYRAGKFYANVAGASQISGYAQGSDEDPVKALEAAFAASPVKLRRPSERMTNGDMTSPEYKAAMGVNEAEVTAAVKEAAIPDEWTQP